MAYLNLDLDFFEHPKTLRVIGLLGVGGAEYVIRLWARIGKFYAKDGQLEGYSASEIEAIIGWHGEPGKAVEAFVKVGFLDRKGREYVAHDWQEHQGHIWALKQRNLKVSRRRWSAISDDKHGSTTRNARRIPKTNPGIPKTNPGIPKTNPGIPKTNPGIPLSFPIRSVPIQTITTTTDLAPEAQQAVEPKPKELTPLQKVVRGFKEAKGIDADNKDWDRKFFSRFSRPAKELLEAFGGDAAAAIAFTLTKSVEWAHLPDWGLEAVVKAAGREYNRIGGENGLKNSEVVHAGLDGQRRLGRTSPSGAIVGDALRDIEKAALRGPETSPLADDEFHRGFDDQN